MDTSPETILAMLTRLRSDPRFEEAIAIALRAMSSPGVTATSSGNVMKTDYLASLYRHRLESAVEGGRHHPGLAAMVAVLADTTDTGWRLVSISAASASCALFCATDGEPRACMSHPTTDP